MDAGALLSLHRDFKAEIGSGIKVRKCTRRSSARRVSSSTDSSNLPDPVGPPSSRFTSVASSIESSLFSSVGFPSVYIVSVISNEEGTAINGGTGDDGSSSSSQRGGMYKKFLQYTSSGFFDLILPYYYKSDVIQARIRRISTTSRPVRILVDPLYIYNNTFLDLVVYLKDRHSDLIIFTGPILSKHAVPNIHGVSYLTIDDKETQKPKSPQGLLNIPPHCPISLLVSFFQSSTSAALSLRVNPASATVQPIALYMCILLVSLNTSSFNDIFGWTEPTQPQQLARRKRRPEAATDNPCYCNCHACSIKLAAIIVLSAEWISLLTDKTRKRRRTRKNLGGATQLPSWVESLGCKTAELSVILG